MSAKQGFWQDESVLVLGAALAWLWPAVPTDLK